MIGCKSVAVVIAICALTTPWFMDIVHSRREVSVDVDDAPGSEDTVPESDSTKARRLSKERIMYAQFKSRHGAKAIDKRSMNVMPPERSAVLQISSDFQALKKPLKEGTMGLNLKSLTAFELADAKTKLKDVSEKHPVDPELKDVLPEGSEEYAFAYPCEVLASGGFVYYKGGEIIAINKVAGPGSSLHFKQFQLDGNGEFAIPDAQDCKEDTAGYHAVTPFDNAGILSEWLLDPTVYHAVTLFDNAEKYCWQPECKVAGDKTLGCFVYIMTNGQRRAYVTQKSTASSGGDLPNLPADKVELGFKKVEKLDTKLGHISEKHAVDPSVKGLPENSAEYAFAYPLVEEGSHISHGAFVYYDKDNNVVGILSVSKEKGKDLVFEKKATGKISDLPADKDCPSDAEKGYHDITLFKDAEKFCWMPECKIVDDKTLGCFMYKMKNGEYRAYVTSSALRPAVASILVLLSALMATFQ